MSSDANTAQAYVMLAHGFEEIEALTPVDFLRRAGVCVATVAVPSQKNIKHNNCAAGMIVGSHGVPVQADCTLADIHKTVSADSMIVLPGGLPGAGNLGTNQMLISLLRKHNEQGGFIAALCAAPARVLSTAGLLQNKKFTCYPSMETEVAAIDSSAVFSDNLVVRDGTIITSRGPATAALFSKELISILKNTETAETVWKNSLHSLVINENS